MFRTKEVPLEIGDNKFTLILEIELEENDDSFGHEFGIRVLNNYELKSFVYEIKETNNLTEFNLDPDFIEDVANEELDVFIREIESEEQDDALSFDTYEEMYG